MALITLWVVYFVLQTKTQDKAQAQPLKRKCAVCANKLSSSWSKAVCRTCIEGLVKDDPVASCQKMLTSVRDELASTFSSFRTLIDKLQTPAESPSSLKASVSTPQQAESEDSEAEVRSTRSSLEESGSDTEPRDRESTRGSRFKLSVEDVDDLLKAIYTTLELKEEEVQLSKHDLMYKGLHKRKSRVFPVHSSLVDTIKLEWDNPERKPFFSSNLKRRFPFDEDTAQPWNKNPKLDAPLSKVSKNSDLAFDDMGTLKDPMDKRGDILLHRAWDSAVGNLKPALASTCVARNLEVWLTQIQSHLSAGTSREQILKSFPLLFQAVGFLADSSAESVRMSARTSALVNSARRSLWLKTWSGDSASKLRLCGLPLTGDHLFGPGLQEALERTADKKKAFPEKKSSDSQKIFSWPKQATES